MSDLIIVGTGGHAKSVFDACSVSYFNTCVGFYDPYSTAKTYLGLPVFKQFDPDARYIIAIGDNYTRLKEYKSNPYGKLETVVHESAYVSYDSKIGEGTVIMAGATVAPGCVIGKGCIINTGAHVDHDCVMGDFSSLAPGVTLGGNVHIGEGSAICIGATVKHGVRIGHDTVVGAGSVVLSDLPPFLVAYGVPCKVVRSRKYNDRYL